MGSFFFLLPHPRPLLKGERDSSSYFISLPLKGETQRGSFCPNVDDLTLSLSYKERGVFLIFHSQLPAILL